MPRPHPQEFSEDVVRVAHDREDGVTIEQIATDFGVHPMTSTKCLRQADVDEDTTTGRRANDSAELREFVAEIACWSRRPMYCVGQRRIYRRPTSREKVLPAPK